MPMHWRILPTFYSIRFSVVRLILRSLIFELKFFCIGIDMDLAFYMLTYTHVSIFVQYAFFLPLYIFRFFVKSQVFIDVSIKTVFMLIPSHYHYCSSIREIDVSVSFFIVQDCFCYPGFSVFPCDIEYFKGLFMQSAFWYLNVIVIIDCQCSGV